MATATASISKASLDLLAAHAIPGSIFEVGAPMSDGRYVITLDAEVRARLERIDPDVDVAIATLCSGQLGRA